MTQLFNVLGLDASDSVVRAVAFALPIAVFCTLLVLLVVMAKRKGKRTRTHAASAKAAAPDTASRARATDDETGEASTVARLVTDGAVGRRAQPVSPPQPVARAAAPPAGTVPIPSTPPTAQPAPASSPETGFETIKAKLSAAQAADQNALLAPLYLELAAAYHSAGREGDRLNALRSAAGIGALHGPKGAHASARLELAEIALRNGDAIGACEQWQIARLAFHEDGQKESYHRVDKRMRENGCPTDWVLTDF